MSPSEPGETGVHRCLLYTRFAYQPLRFKRTLLMPGRIWQRWILGRKWNCDVGGESHDPSAGTESRERSLDKRYVCARPTPQFNHRIIHECSGYSTLSLCRQPRISIFLLSATMLSRESSTIGCRRQNFPLAFVAGHKRYASQ
jgi:hypothetical protein